MKNFSDTLQAKELYLKEIGSDINEAKLRIIQNFAADFVKDQIPGLGIDFNVFNWKQEQLMGIILGMFLKIGAAKSIDSMQNLLEFTLVMCKNYYDNPYHSFNHGVDVTYMTYYIIEHLGVGEQLDLTTTDKAILLIAALGHDVQHPGTNNLFQVNSKAPAALKYKNVSVLENQSADFVKSCLEKSSLLESLEILALEPEWKAKVISRITEHIIRTDMTYHFGMFEQLIELASINTSPITYLVHSNSGGSKKDLLVPRTSIDNLQGNSFLSLSLAPKIIFNEKVQKEQVMHIILHLADISNPARPFIICEKWAELVMQEFFNQGTMEKERQLPISPNMDSEVAQKVPTQISFIEFIVDPVFEHFKMIFPTALSLVDLVSDNHRQWECKLDGINSITFPSINPSPKTTLASLTRSNARNSARRLSSAAGTIEIPESLQKYSKSFIKRNDRSNVERKEEYSKEENLKEEDELST